MSEGIELPELQLVVRQYRAEPKVRDFAKHNITVWRDINGASRVVNAHRITFEPRADYWYQTERRFLVAYFAKRFDGCYAPALALRRLAQRTFRHFDRARADGELGAPLLVARHPGGWSEFAGRLRAVAENVPKMEEYEQLRRVHNRLKEEDSRADLLAFLTSAASVDVLGEIEPAFFKRIRWFPYLGLPALEGLEARQLFFGAFYVLFTSTNSYKVGGGMSFAPILQNNAYGTLLHYAQRWAGGESPDETGFVIESKGDEAARDRSHYTPVVELFGFLNLHRNPFYNSAAAAYDAFKRPEDTSVIPAVKRIGDLTRRFLAEQRGLADELASEFRRKIEQLELPNDVQMEGIQGARARERFPDEQTHLVDGKLRSLIARGGVERVTELSDQEAAATFFHIMLDAVTYGARLEDKAARSGSVAAPVDSGETGGTASPGAVREAEPAPAALDIELAQPLVATANDALAYLRGGFHVLLAGAPGTGKTTMAQLVGHAWNVGLDRVSTRIPMSRAPLTTVANSAWAPFHTIGGILPDASGTFRSQKGVFIDPAEGDHEGQWRLRGECVVLDEMNRADLDRCIGELYPLLTNNVDSVVPAGIPGVRRILANPAFRLVATVNDATLDDVVFPISEGLARRFIRIELRGAVKEDVLGYVASAAADEQSRARVEAAHALLASLYSACENADRLTETEFGAHLPFGVGYFGLLRAWVRGELPMSAEFVERDLADQAFQVMSASLRSAVRDRGFEMVFRELASAEVGG